MVLSETSASTIAKADIYQYLSCMSNGFVKIAMNRINLYILIKITCVLCLLWYEAFYDLFSHNDPQKFGGESVKWLYCSSISHSLHITLLH